MALTSVIFALSLIAVLDGGNKAVKRPKQFDFSKYKQEIAHPQTPGLKGVESFQFLPHEKEIAEDVKNIDRQWSSLAQRDFENWARAELNGLSPPSRLPISPTYIFVGVGSTTSQCFFVLHGGKPKPLRRSISNPAESLGYNFGSKNGLTEEQAKAFLKEIDQQREKVAAVSSQYSHLKAQDIPIFFGKSIQWALAKKGVKSLDDVGLALPGGQGPMSGFRKKGTPQVVKAVNVLHKAYEDMKLTNMFLMQARDLEPPFGWIAQKVRKNPGTPVVDIGGGGMDAYVDSGAVKEKGTSHKQKESSNTMYVKFLKGEIDEKALADFQLEGVKVIETEQDIRRKDGKMEKHPAMKVETNAKGQDKIKLYQTGAMRKAYFDWCDKDGHPACDSAHAVMQFNQLYQNYDDFAPRPENYRDNARYEDEEVYAMYEEAADNLDRAQKEFDIATRLLKSFR